VRERPDLTDDPRWVGEQLPSFASLVERSENQASKALFGTQKKGGDLTLWPGLRLLLDFFAVLIEICLLFWL